jgi:hypothetical protein
MVKLGLWYYNTDKVVKDGDGYWVYGDNIQGASEADVSKFKSAHVDLERRMVRKSAEKNSAAADAAAAGQV